MSFTNDIKKELSAITLKNTCCRRAFASGLVFGNVIDDNNKVILRFPAGECSEFCSKILKDRFGKSLCLIKNATKRGEEYEIFELESTLASVFLKDKVEVVSKSLKCDYCLNAFLRGVFVSLGTVNDPHSASYHAEFIFQDVKSARFVHELLGKLDLTSGITNRKNGTIGLYYKSSTNIEELLVTLGATNAAFELMNCKIERTIRNEENRATNCVARNISRSVEASRRQIEEIEMLVTSGRIDTLPYDLRVTARLRLENPESSLTELALMHVPPISKSGLNHRLQKLSDESKKVEYS